MRVVQINYRRFRGFRTLEIKPRGHVLLVGEPRAGRSDALEGLSRVLGYGTVRVGDPDELDFYNSDTTQRAEVEATLADLGVELEQLFFDYLEFWDVEEEALIDELDAADELDDEKVISVVRLCYRIEWDDGEGAARDWVDFSKSSDPAAGIFTRLNRTEREALPFVGWNAPGRVLSLAPRAAFRALVDAAPGDDLEEALDELVSSLEEAGAELATVEQVSTALEAVIEPWRQSLDIGDAPAKDIVSFLPEGGVVAAILRSLAPAMTLPKAPDGFPLARHGATTQALAFHGQVIARAASTAVVAFDDFGDRIDAASARHSASLLRKRSAQLWLATRVPQVADAFSPDEIVRFSWTTTGRRTLNYGERPESKAERLAARHLSTQIMPAMSAAAVVIVEGPHDRQALEALQEKLLVETGALGLAAHRIALIDAAAAEGAGGTGAVVRLADAAVEFGFRTAVVLDQDRAEQAAAELEAAREASDAVIRLPDGFAIERALCDGLSDDVIADALRSLVEAFAVHVHDGWESLTGRPLRQAAVRALKQSGGMHAEFVAALPEGEIPTAARAIIEAAIEAGTGRVNGLIQL
jgi:putative ATP-dependent endonuclease of the OLD family